VGAAGAAETARRPNAGGARFAAQDVPPIQSAFVSFLLLAPVLSAQDLNLALGGTATQSSFAGFGEQAGYAIDGNRDGYWWSNSTTCIANQPGSWWQVVLNGPPQLVHEVVIYNRATAARSG
jgi:hypothetical protein